MRKVFVLLILLMFTATMLFAGGQQAQSAAAGGKTKISLQFGNWWEKKAPGLEAAFEAAFPQYDLEIILLPIAGYFDNAAVAILGGTAPDILDIDVTQISTFAGKNLLRDIGPLVGNKVKASDFIKSAWDSTFYNGKMYGFANRGSGGVMYLNRTMFEEAGVAYPKEGWTYDDFLAIAQKITVPGVKYGASIAADPSDPSNVFSSFSPVLWAYKGDYLSADGKRCLLNTPEAVRAIAFWTELLTKHKVVPEGSVNFTSTRDIAPLFEQNKIAMMIHGLGGIQQFGANPNVKFDLVQVPGGITRAGGWAYTIPVSVPDNKVNAAVDFMLWYAQPAIQSTHSEIEPSNIAAWDIAPPWNGEMYKQFVIGANNGKGMPSVGAWGDASKIIITELQNALLGRKTPQQAGNDMVNQINPLL